MNNTISVAITILLIGSVYDSFKYVWKKTEYTAFKFYGSSSMPPHGMEGNWS
jgi:hypothetical protein